MPTYEYRCKDCGHRFDVLYRSISAAEEAAQPRCPECGSADSQRVLRVHCRQRRLDRRQQSHWRSSAGSAPAGITQEPRSTAGEPAKHDHSSRSGHTATRCWLSTRVSIQPGLVDRQIPVQLHCVTARR